jgi:hypothetical protein
MAVLEDVGAKWDAYVVADILADVLDDLDGGVHAPPPLGYFLWANYSQDQA